MENAEIRATDLLCRACCVCSVEDCIEIVDSRASMDDKSDAVHTMVHVTSTLSYTDLFLAYASAKCIELIAVYKGERVMGERVARCE